jgi:hypothetical protein
MWKLTSIVGQPRVWHEAGELEDEEFIVIVEIAKVYKSKRFAVVD